MGGTPVVEMRNIVKRFPGVLANDHVNFAAYPSKIHAILGENGAGKSTLMNILSGLYRPDSGEIRLFGERVNLKSPRDAISRGVGMVHQHFMLVETQTVTENVILGLDVPRFFLNTRQSEEQVAELAKRYGLDVDPSARIWQLSVGEQQRVEILKILYRGAKILILDEPTAVLTPQETDELFVTLRQMAAQGHAIIFISHKLGEVMAIADHITVLRRGRVVGEVDPKETTKANLARMMVGREVLFHLEKPPLEPGKPVLEVQDVHAMGDKGVPALKGVTLEVHEREILGIAGVAGNGQRELAEVVTGMRRCTDGKVLVRGEDLTNKGPLAFIKAGVGHIPEDRTAEGAIGGLSLMDNLILKSYREEPGGFLNYKKIRKRAEKLVKEFDVQAPAVDTLARVLSGGNLQKLILAREISADPAILVAVHPTQGLDVGATESVRRSLLDQRARGCAVLLISEDLDEVMQLSDRIAVIYEGEIMNIIPAAGADRNEIGLMMAGTRVEA